MTWNLFTITDAHPGTAEVTPIFMDAILDINMGGLELVGTKSQLNRIEAHTLVSDQINSNEYGVVAGSSDTFTDTISVKNVPIVPQQRALFRQREAAGVDGGSLPPDHWFHFPVNYEEYNDVDGCFLDGNGWISLEAGRYTIQCVVPVFGIEHGQIRLRKSTNAGVSWNSIAYSTTTFTGGGWPVTNEIGVSNIVLAPVNITQTTLIRYELQGSDGNAKGRGQATGIHAYEYYAEYFITKVG